MENQVVIKTVRKEFTDKIKAGIAWYSFIGVINNIKLARKEVELLSFINYRGTISSSSSKEEFCKVFNSSSATISNMVSTLSKKKLLVKEKGKIKLNPALRVDFSNNLVVRLYIDIKKEIIEEIVNED